MRQSAFANCCALLIGLLLCTSVRGASPESDETPDDVHQEEASRPVELFPVLYKGRWGFIDRQGEMVIEPRFLDAEPFSEGLAAVEIEVSDDFRWGFIGTDGELSIDPQLNGAAIVRCRTGNILDYCRKMGPARTIFLSL